MTGRPTRRYRTAAGTARRQPRVRRASSGLTPVRASALLAILVSAGAIFGLTTTSAFGFERIEISGALLTPTSDVEAAAGVSAGQNLVSLSTEPIAARILGLPSVHGVSLSVGLPDTLLVALEERRPIVVWQVGSVRYAVDSGGMLFADITTDPGGVSASIPVVVDDRAEATGYRVRGNLDPVILDAATRIASLTPSQIGSHAPSLAVHVTDERGFTVSSGPGGWVAVFGFYGPSLRTPALIPGQVQLLTTLLAGREDRIETVILADATDGTYTPKATPKASAKPSAKPSPSAAP
jgi:hypothetical protein